MEAIAPPPAVAPVPPAPSPAPAPKAATVAARIPSPPRLNPRPLLSTNHRRVWRLWRDMAVISILSRFTQPRRFLATGSDDQTAKLMAAVVRQLVCDLCGDSGGAQRPWVVSVAFSPNRAASGDRQR